MYVIHFDDTPTAEVDNPNNDEAILKLIRWKAGVLWDGPEKKANPDELLRYLNNLMDQEIKNPGRPDHPQERTPRPAPAKVGTRAEQSAAVRILHHARVTPRG